MGKGKPKKKLALPKVAVAPDKRTGNPASLLPGGSNSHERLCWRFEHVDHDGPWGFDDTAMAEILVKMRDCERMTLRELRNTSDLFVEYDVPGGLCKTALDRLAVLGWDDMTAIQRLRFMGKQRLYGFLDGNIFHVLWWDPEHQVYPSQKRHT